MMATTMPATGDLHGRGRPRPSTPTHEVTNVPGPLGDLDLFTGDIALAQVVRSAAPWAVDRASAVGKTVGSAEVRDLARLANEHLPSLRRYDGVGNRLDVVEHHPAYHELMERSLTSGVHSLAWKEQDRPGAHVARAALSLLWNQAENGIACPNSMSFSVVPLLRSDPGISDVLGADIEGLALADRYDPREAFVGAKDGLRMAMTMTEKQGGSDLRANTTTATPTGHDREHVLTGHKWFCSVPTGDIYLLTAQTSAGVTLFLAPRILPDGSRNTIRIKRLKDKLGNRSNASSEIELDGALAYRIGEDGRGIATFIRHMTHWIRHDFTVGSAGIMRAALTFALHHTSNRSAFGARIADLPQMRPVLADLAIESEAAMRLVMRLAEVLDGEDEHSRALARVGVPIAKYWVCKRTEAVVAEALECHGGNGYVEEQPIARLYREAPLNGIWEGTAAMMGLDVVRALGRTHGVRDALLAELRQVAGDHPVLNEHIDDLQAMLDRHRDDLEPHARRIMGRTAVIWQAGLLLRDSTPAVAQAFVRSRLDGGGARDLGTLDDATTVLDDIVERARIA